MVFTISKDTVENWLIDFVQANLCVHAKALFHWAQPYFVYIQEKNSLHF